MPTFVWEGITRRGETRKGELECPDEATVRGVLRRQGYRTVTVKAKPKDLSEYLPFLKPKVKEKNVVVFARIFSTMIGAGLPLIQCLDLLGQEEQNKTFKEVIKTLKEDIEAGATLTEALKNIPKFLMNSLLTSWRREKVVASWMLFSSVSLITWRRR